MMAVVWFLHSDTDELKSVPEMSFYGLQLLCTPKHGDQKEVSCSPHLSTGFSVLDDKAGGCFTLNWCSCVFSPCGGFSTGFST